MAAITRRTRGSSAAGAGVRLALGVAAGFVVAAGEGGFGVARGPAGFLAAAAGFAFAVAAGLSAGGVSTPGGTSEICAAAFAANVRQLARINIGRRIFISGVIPVRLWLLRTSRPAPVGWSAPHPSRLPWHRACHSR